MEIQIVPFRAKYQDAVDKMMREINQEYNLPAAHTNYKPKQPDRYWLALHENEVVGSVALLVENEYAVLKRMFLKAKYRGKEKGVSAKLLSTALDWCKANNNGTIYLGTIDVFKAAMAFYEKNGFIRIAETGLPKDFAHNPIDKVFYKLELKNR